MSRFNEYMQANPSGFTFVDYIKNNSTTTPIQTKFIVTIDRSLTNDKGVTINLKKGDILQGVSRSSMGSMVTDGFGQGLTFTDKSGDSVTAK
jgi:hypothetical protein